MSTLEYRLRADDRELMQSLQRAADGFQRMNRRAQEAEASSARAGAKMSEWAKQLGGIVSGGIILNGLKNIFDEFDRMGDLAKRIGVSAESMQRLGHMAKLSGSDVETMTKALVNITKKLGDAGTEGENARKSLSGLGIDAKKFIDLSPEEQIYMLADAFKNAGGDGEAFANVLDLVGARGGQALIPVLREGSDSLREMGKELTILSDTQVAMIQRVGDMWDTFAANFKATMAEVVLTSRNAAEAMGSSLVSALSEAKSPDLLGFLGSWYSNYTKDLETMNAPTMRGKKKASQTSVLSKLDPFDFASPEKSLLNFAPDQMRTVGDKANRELIAQRIDEYNAALEARIPLLESKLSDAQKRYDEAIARQKSYADVMQRQQDAATFYGKPGQMDVELNAREIDAATGIGMDAARNLAEQDQALQLANAKKMQSRTAQIAEQRRNRILEREGRALIRAKHYLDRGEPGLMGSKPAGIPQEIWDELKAEQAAGMDMTMAKRSARQKMDAAQRELDQAKQDLALNVKNIHDILNTRISVDLLSIAKTMQSVVKQ